MDFKRSYIQFIFVMIFVYSSGIVFFANSVFFRFDPNVIIKSILIVSLIMFIF